MQAGLRAVREFNGCLILPVDTVGVSSATLAATLRWAEQKQPAAVRPTYGGCAGKIAWISRRLADELLRMDSGNTRMDYILKERAIQLPVDDAAILSNVNTPEEWAAAIRKPAPPGTGAPDARPPTGGTRP